MSDTESIFLILSPELNILGVTLLMSSSELDGPGPALLKPSPVLQVSTEKLKSFVAEKRTDLKEKWPSKACCHT